MRPRLKIRLLLMAVTMDVSPVLILLIYNSDMIIKMTHYVRNCVTFWNHFKKLHSLIYRVYNNFVSHTGSFFSVGNEKYRSKFLISIILFSRLKKLVWDHHCYWRLLHACGALRAHSYEGEEIRSQGLKRMANSEEEDPSCRPINFEAEEVKSKVNS